MIVLLPTLRHLMFCWVRPLGSRCPLRQGSTAIPPTLSFPCLFLLLMYRTLSKSTFIRRRNLAVGLSQPPEEWNTFLRDPYITIAKRTGVAPNGSYAGIEHGEHRECDARFTDATLKYCVWRQPSLLLMAKQLLGSWMQSDIQSWNFDSLV